MLKLAVFFDGSCGPGMRATAAYGFVVKDAETGRVLHTGSGRAAKGREATCNVGEYVALYQAMLYVQKEFPSADAIFHGDSVLVIRQMRGESKARKGKYLPFYRDSIELAKTYIDSGQWQFVWIPRAFNSEADDLAQYYRF